MVFSCGFRQELETVSKKVRRALEPRLLLGCSGGGVIGNGREYEGLKALSITIARLPDVELQGFHIDSASLPSPDAAPQEWWDALEVPQQADSTPHFVLFADPFSFELEAFLRGLDYAYPRSQKIGGVAGNARRAGGNRLLLDQQLFSRGLVGVGMSGLKLEPLVMQGARPIGEAHTVTSGQRNLIFTLDHKPALAALEETLKGLPRRDRKRAERALLLGVESKAGLSLAALMGSAPRPSEYLMRNLIGADLKRGALAVGAAVRPGQRVQFHLRDAQAADEDLKASFAAHRSSPPAGALLFSCSGRGESLFGESDHESQLFQSTFPGVPLGGFFGGGEIGPVGDTTSVHGFTSCFALFRELD